MDEHPLWKIRAWGCLMDEAAADNAGSNDMAKADPKGRPVRRRVVDGRLLGYRIIEQLDCGHTVVWDIRTLMPPPSWDRWRKCHRCGTQAKGGRNGRQTP